MNWGHLREYIDPAGWRGENFYVGELGKGLQPALGQQLMARGVKGFFTLIWGRLVEVAGYSAMGSQGKLDYFYGVGMQEFLIGVGPLKKTISSV